MLWILIGLKIEIINFSKIEKNLGKCQVYGWLTEKIILEIFVVIMKGFEM